MTPCSFITVKSIESILSIYSSAYLISNSEWKITTQLYDLLLFRSSLIYNTMTGATGMRHECNTSDTSATQVRHERHQCNTSATRVLHERHECDMSATRTTRVWHEWKNLILIKTLVKTYFHTPLFAIWKIKITGRETISF